MGTLKLVTMSRPDPMGPDRYLLAIVLVTIWAATQWVAGGSAISRQLGSHGSKSFRHAGLSSIPRSSGVPMTLSRRSSSRGLPRSFRLFSLCVHRCPVWRLRRKWRDYGSARWATSSEIRPQSATPTCFVVPINLRHDGPEHVCALRRRVLARVSFLVVPTLLTWPGKCIVHDIKGEMLLTSGFRPGMAACCCRCDQRGVSSLQSAC